MGTWTLRAGLCVDHDGPGRRIEAVLRTLRDRQYQVAGFRVWILGLRVFRGLGFRVWILGLRAFRGLGLRVWILGLRV